MSDINTVNISGRLGADPIIKYFESGSVTAEISIAVNKYNSKEGKETATWHVARAWGKRAEYIGEYAKSGDAVIITGSLEKDVYKDKDGKTRANSYILISQIKTLPRKEEK